MIIDKPRAILIPIIFWKVGNNAIVDICLFVDLFMEGNSTLLFLITTCMSTMWTVLFIISSLLFGTFYVVDVKPTGKYVEIYIAVFSYEVNAGTVKDSQCNFIM